MKKMLLPLVALCMSGMVVAPPSPKATGSPKFFAKNQSVSRLKGHAKREVAMTAAAKREPRVSRVDVLKRDASLYGMMKRDDKMPRSLKPSAPVGRKTRGSRPSNLSVVIGDYSSSGASLSSPSRSYHRSSTSSPKSPSRASSVSTSSRVPRSASKSPLSGSVASRISPARGGAGAWPSPSNSSAFSEDMSPIG